MGGVDLAVICDFVSNRIKITQVVRVIIFPNARHLS